MFSRVFNRVGRSAAAKPARTQCRKTSSHAKAPYEPHHEPSIYGNTPLPFGVGPNYKFEGWEVPVIVTYALVAGMFVYAELIDTDNETPMEWARREAIARKTVVDNGGEVKFGKYYMYTTFSEKEGEKKFAGPHEVKIEDFKYLPDEDDE